MQWKQVMKTLPQLWLVLSINVYYQFFSFQRKQKRCKPVLVPVPVYNNSHLQRHHSVQDLATPQQADCALLAMNRTSAWTMDRQATVKHILQRRWIFSHHFMTLSSFYIIMLLNTCLENSCTPHLVELFPAHRNNLAEALHNIINDFAVDTERDGFNSPHSYSFMYKPCSRAQCTQVQPPHMDGENKTLGWLPPDIQSQLKLSWF